MERYLKEAIEVVASLWPDDIPHEEIADAIGSHEGHNHEILSIEEMAVSQKFPVGTRYFLVQSQHPLSIGGVHIFGVYLYGRACVTIGLMAMRITTDDEIIRLLSFDDSEQ